MQPLIAGTFRLLFFYSLILIFGKQSRTLLYFVRNALKALWGVGGVCQWAQ